VVFVAVSSRDPNRPEAADVAASVPPRPPDAVGIVADDLDQVLPLAPLDEEMEAVVRFHAPDGPPRAEDAKVVWEMAEARYIRVLKEESFEASAFNTYITTELIFAAGNSSTGPGNFAIVKLLARSRRFAKLLRHVAEAEAAGASAEAVNVLAGTIRKLMAERARVFAELAVIAKETPLLFSSPETVPETERREWGDRMVGHALSSPEAPPGLIPLSLDGTKLAIAANVFLLGYTEHPDAVGPILSVAGHDEGEDRLTVKGAFLRPDTFVIPQLEIQNWFVIGDALDRIMVAATDRTDLSPDAKAIAGEYVRWRSEQGWQERERATVIAYDDPSVNPHSFRGMIVAPVETRGPAVECQLDLCLQFGRYSDLDADCPDGVMEVVAWAERFNAAL